MRPQTSNKVVVCASEWAIDTRTVDREHRLVLRITAQEYAEAVIDIDGTQDTDEIVRLRHLPVITDIGAIHDAIPHEACCSTLHPQVLMRKLAVPRLQVEVLAFIKTYGHHHLVGLMPQRFIMQGHDMPTQLRPKSRKIVPIAAGIGNGLVGTKNQFIEIG